MLSNFKSEVFPQESKVNTLTTFCPDGRVYIYPCGFESVEVHHDERPIIQRGSLHVKEDGTSEFLPVKKSVSPQFLRIFSTPVSEIRVYRKVGQLVIRFPYDVPTNVANNLIAEASKAAMDYLKKSYPKQFSLNQ